MSLKKVLEDLRQQTLPKEIRDRVFRIAASEAKQGGKHFLFLDSDCQDRKTLQTHRGATIEALRRYGYVVLETPEGFQVALCRPNLPNQDVRATILDQLMSEADNGGVFATIPFQDTVPETLGVTAWLQDQGVEVEANQEGLKVQWGKR